MATYYGTLRGTGRTTVTKTGTKNTGLTASVQTYKGSVIVSVYGELDGKPAFTIELADGSGASGQTAFYGTLDELRAKLEK